MHQTREELESEILAQYRTLGRAMKATHGPVWMETDLTIAQLRTLLVLAEDGVQAGLAERAEDPEDRRRTLAQLTPKGEDLYARLLNHTQQMQTWIQKMDNDDLAALLQGIRAINRVIE